MDIYTMLTVQKMYKDEDIDFDKWLKSMIEELEIHEDERYKEQHRQT